MTIDLVPGLPNEIFELIFLNLSSTTLLECRRVSNSWKEIADNDNLWRSNFRDQKYWKYNNDDSETDSWYELYKERYLLELNLKNDKYLKYKLYGFSYAMPTYCVKFFKNLFLAGSGRAIKIWDIETSHCLSILGEPDKEILTQLNVPYLDHLTTMEISELIKNINVQFHLNAVTCIDINEKYMVSGSFDGSCIIWKLPDFKPIYRLIVPWPEEITGNIFIKNVVTYNDYIVHTRGNAYIEVWKSSFDNSEHELQFYFLYRLKGKRYVGDISIHDGIIYSEARKVITTWNLETGQLIQKFQYDHVFSMEISDKYLFVGEKDKITVWDLQSHELIDILSDQKARILSINDNRILSVDHDNTIRIRDLDDHKLLKEYKNLYLNITGIPLIYIDSKRMVVCTTGCSATIYDYSANLRKKYLKHL